MNNFVKLKYTINRKNILFEGGKKLKLKKKTITKNKQPTITIITVVKNNQKFLEKTILSILNQNYKNIEYIIIDGGSTDNTLKIIKKYINQIDYVISQKDKGLYDAINKGLSVSTGNVIGIVNSDDLLTKNSLKILCKYYIDYPKCDFFFGTVKKHWGTLHGFHPWKINFSWFFYTSHSTGFFIKKEAAQKIGKYSLKYKNSSDFDYFYRMIKEYKFNGVATKKNEIFGIFRPGGISSNLDFWDHFYEKNQIRLDNKQNKYFIFLMIILKIFFNYKKLKKFKLIKFYNFIKKNYL